MGNGLGKFKGCFSASSTSSAHMHSGHHDIVLMVNSDPTIDEGLGHSFCYIRPSTSLPDETTSKFKMSSSKVYSDENANPNHPKNQYVSNTVFRSISGASVSANTSTALTAAAVEQYNNFVHRTSSHDRAAAFESTDSFTAVPLQRIPRSTSVNGFFSGPLERGFLSGPLERGYASGPLDALYNAKDYNPTKSKVSSVISTASRPLRRALSRTGRALSQTLSMSGEFSSTITTTTMGSSDMDSTSCESNSQNLQWAQGKAGEDRVHVVLSEDDGWLFVGIYDGFNGPDAPDYLLSNLYNYVHSELKNLNNNSSSVADNSSDVFETQIEEPPSKKKAKKSWKHEWKKERIELDRQVRDSCCLPEKINGKQCSDHGEVLKALSRALSRTEEAYLEMADRAVGENPELALMGSCVLVMVMMGEDVYVMNVGDSRVVVGQELKGSDESLQRINEEIEGGGSSHFLDDFNEDGKKNNSLSALQLTLDHSTNIEEEVQRIKAAHKDDVLSISNDRVKGTLKVTRAFGAGFLKQRKWNDALLKMFRIDYVGTAPYITCTPSLRHHKLGPEDHFLILSSDGLYQYFTNEEVVNEVEWFMEASPDGDPAQHLVEEVLFRAAKKAGMDFHELLEIPQGDRRKYHDDVSVMVVSLEGRIWRSSV